jgi:hypothetical protein
LATAPALGTNFYALFIANGTWHGVCGSNERNRFGSGTKSTRLGTGTVAIIALRRAGGNVIQIAIILGFEQLVRHFESNAIAFDFQFHLLRREDFWLLVVLLDWCNKILFLIFQRAEIQTLIIIKG